MEILLDTTVQIERIFKRKRKREIEKVISEYVCGSSTFVLGEYKYTMVKDFVTLYNIMQIEDNLVGVREHINDNVFHRSFQRVYYVFNDLCKMYEDDYDLIKEELHTYPKRLERRFKYGLEPKLLNGTECHRAGAKVIFEKEKADIPEVNCTKRDEFCRSCQFWKENEEKVSGLEKDKELEEKLKNALEKALAGEQVKGNLCRSLGDCIISLEALETEKKMVCTTNIKDFKPICDYIGIKICNINCD